MRTLGSAGSELSATTAASVQGKLLNVAAQVHVSVRRVDVQLSSAYPLKDLFARLERRSMRLASASS